VSHTLCFVGHCVCSTLTCVLTLTHSLCLSHTPRTYMYSIHVLHTHMCTHTHTHTHSLANTPHAHTYILYISILRVSYTTHTHTRTTRTRCGHACNAADPIYITYVHTHTSLTTRTRTSTCADPIYITYTLASAPTLHALHASLFLTIYIT